MLGIFVFARGWNHSCHWVGRVTLRPDWLRAWYACEDVEHSQAQRPLLQQLVNIVAAAHVGVGVTSVPRCQWHQSSSSRQVHSPTRVAPTTSVFVLC